MGHPQKSRKEQRRYTSALPGAQGLGACACSGSGGPLVLARGTFQRDSLRGGERFPRASSGQPHFERGWRPSSANCRRWKRLDCSCACWCLDPSDDHSPRQRCRGVDDLSDCPECSSETLSSLASFYLAVSFSANTALVCECRPATPSRASPPFPSLPLDPSRSLPPRPLQLLIRLTNCTLDLVL